jgi:hypothetical protein
MKKLFFFLTLSSLVYSSAANAVEYKTFFKSSSNTVLDIPLVSTDLVEIVSHGVTSQARQQGSISLRSEEGAGGLITVGNMHDGGTHSAVGYKFTGLTSMKIDGYIDFITLKITNASEINKAGPTTILVLPENATGNYNLLVESSTDSINWIPFHSGTVNSDTAERLFRVRIVHKGQEEAKAKAEEK